MQRRGESLPIPGTGTTRAAERRAVTMPARLTWKDHHGTTRFASVVTRNVSEQGVYVECESAVSIPLYRLVQFQLEKEAGDVERVPATLRQGRVLSAVWRVGPCRSSKGTPNGYALRFLVDPHAGAARSSAPRMAVAS